MAIVDGRTLIDAADVTTNWDDLTGAASGSANTENFIEGTASISVKVSQTVDGLLHDAGSAQDRENHHLYFWQFNANPGALQTKASGGIRARFCGATVTDWFEVNIDGSNTYLGGWKMYAIDIEQAAAKPDATNGTPPATSAIRYMGVVWDVTSMISGNVDNCFIDAMWVLDEDTFGIRVEGQAAGPTDYTWDDVVDAGDINDATKAWGTVRRQDGIVFLNTPVRFGTTSTSESGFIDTNEIVAWENQPVSDNLYKIDMIGGADPDNNMTFGAASGSSNAKEASGGGTIVSGSSVVPFRIEAISSDTDAQFFGTSFLNPVTIHDDECRRALQEDNSGGPSFVDETLDSNSTTVNDIAFFPAGSGVNDAYYLGHNERFPLLKVDTGTAGAGAYVVTWEYSQGSSSWDALTDVTDGTSNFKTTGLQTVSYSVADDWATDTVDGNSLYWIRARRDSGTVTTDPLGSQVFLQMMGDVRLEHATAEAIRCGFTNMGTVRVRNDAILKKCTITDSVAPAKTAALDLGASDPLLNSVRDLVIQNCNKGILLQGNSTSAELNFRNISFANNTNDVRVDFASTDQVTINILEGGTSFASTDVDNVNGTTVIVNAAVTLQVTVNDTASVPISSANVGIFESTTVAEAQLMNELTSTAGIATESFNYSADLGVSVRVRLGDSTGTNYVPVNSAQTITGDGLTLTVTMDEDANNIQ